jgi:hypothetical protein
MPDEVKAPEEQVYYAEGSDGSPILFDGLVADCLTFLDHELTNEARYVFALLNGKVAGVSVGVMLSHVSELVRLLEVRKTLSSIDTFTNEEE